MSGYWVVIGVIAFTICGLLKIAAIEARLGDRDGVRNCVWLAGVAWVGMIWAVFNLVIELSEKGS